MGTVGSAIQDFQDKTIKTVRAAGLTIKGATIEAVNIVVGTIKNLPPVHFGTSLYHFGTGDTNKGKEAFARGIQSSLAMGESTPVVGHLMAAGYSLAGYKEEASQAFKKATRTTLVMGAGAAVVLTGGTAAGIIGAGVAAGQGYDLIRGESKIVAAGKAIYSGEAENFGASLVQLGATVYGDIGFAKAGAACANRIKALQEPECKKVNLDKITSENKGEKVPKKCPKKEILYYNKETNHYSKEMSKESAESFKLATEKKLGVNCKLETLPNDKVMVMMEGGIPLERAIEIGLISPESALKQVAEMQSKMESLEFAHGDMKTSNLTVMPKVLGNADIKMIDCGDFDRYRKLRPVKTPGVNTSQHVEGHTPGTYGKGTDMNGYQEVVSVIKNAKTPTIPSHYMLTGLAPLLLTSNKRSEKLVAEGRDAA